MKRVLILLLIISLKSAALHAQENIRSILQDTVNLDEVVVTGTAVKVNRSNVPMAVSVVGTTQLNQSIETALLPALNGRVPGLFVTERGIMGFGVSAGAAGQISIRGVGGSPTTGVLMLIDGHPQFMGIFGHPLPDSYVASDVEKVEVIRGPASILYGSNAMGGVINIITRKQKKEGLHGNAHLMAGSHNTSKYMASGGYKKDGFSAFVSMNHDRTNGHRDNADFRITNGYVKLAYAMNKNLDITADLSLAQFNAQDPGPDTLNAIPGNILDVTRGYWSLTLNNDYGRYSGTVKLFHNFGEHNISDGFHSNDVNYGVNIFETVKLFEGNTITLGADYLIYGGKAENEIFNSFITDTSIYDAGLYGFIQQTLFGSFTLNAGLRVQNHETYGTEWIPAGGFAWKPGPTTTLKGSVAKGFRSPTIRELFVWNHNVNLIPEKIINYETGIYQTFRQNRLRLELTGFIVNGKDLIITVPMQGLQNAGEVANRGIEFSGTASINKNLILTTTYSYTHMEKTVYATPKHNLFASIDYNLKKLHAMISVQHIDKLDTDPAVNSEKMETYTLLNSKVSYRLFNWCELFVSAENILNQEYENNIWYPMPGITAFGGVKMNF
ncbi:MAG: TonB-dependent receptor [Bacteroidales bacterium]|jgi:iron complex outermembrane receptor protein|nr:TonB-dependent receptor [Bacteroidales bacterium]